MDTIRILDRRQQCLDRRIELGKDIFRFLLFQRLDQSAEHGIESSIQGGSSDLDQRAQSSRVECGDGLDNERGYENREDAVRSDLSKSQNLFHSNRLTLMTSLRACRAVSELSPGFLIASRSVGIVWSIALAPM